MALALTRADLREILRSRIGEKIADHWTDVRLDKLLDAGLQQVERTITRVRPEAFTKTVKSAVTVDHYYSFPPDILYERELRLVNRTSLAYYIVPKRPFHEVTIQASDGQPKYCHDGQYFYLGPAPAALGSDFGGIGVASALDLHVNYIYALVLAADGDVPPFAPPLHIAVAVWAWKLTLPEASELQGEARNELQDLLGDIPNWSYDGASDPPTLNPDVEMYEGR